MAQQVWGELDDPPGLFPRTASVTSGKSKKTVPPTLTLQGLKLFQRGFEAAEVCPVKPENLNHIVCFILS